MATDQPDLPDWLRACQLEPDAVYGRTVHSGMVIGSGLATSEPVSFYAGLWDHVRAHDVTDLEIRNGLFLTPHPILVGRADEDVELPELPDLPGPLDALERLAARVGDRVGDLVQLRRLEQHVEELERRRIVLRSAFLGPALNTFVPDHPVTRLVAPRLAGRNRVTAGFVRYQPAHFPDAAWALALDTEGHVAIDLLVQPMSWPRDGRLSFGLSNGVNGDVAERLLRDAEAGAQGRASLLLYLNRQMPFLPGEGNTFLLDRLRGLADAGRLHVVVEDTPPPGIPPGSFDDPSDVDRTIARTVVDHVDEHVDLVEGRNLQVGIGTISVLVVRALRDSPWTGGAVTEMLEPATYALLDDGTVRAPVRCTFAMGEQGDDFHRRLDGDDRVQMESAGRLMQPATFEGGFGINNVLAIDFSGNVNATARDHHPYSAVGGLATIMRGLAVGGIAYLCMRSTHRSPDGETRSSVMAGLPSGTPVAITGNDLMGTREGARVFLATEHGIARISSLPLDELITALVRVAHPDHRDELAAAAWDRFRVRV